MPAEEVVEIPVEMEEGEYQKRERWGIIGRFALKRASGRVPGGWARGGRGML
jgi:hypothetical protein